MSSQAERLRAIFAENSLSSDVCENLISLYERKLWHELTGALREVFDSEAYELCLHDIFDAFILDFGHKLNLLSFAHFVHDVAKQMDKDAAVALLTTQVEGLEKLKGKPVGEPVLYLKMSIAEHHIDVSHMDVCKAQLDSGLQQLETMADVDPAVSAAVYNVAALFAKARQDFSAYYRAALQYLCFVSVDDLPKEEALALARDISLAALLGDSVFSFAELLLHPVVKCLLDTPYAWLQELLHCFSAGNLSKYEQLCKQYGSEMNAQPALVAAERKLRQKLTIMSLVALVAGLPPDQRKIQLSTIAARTHLKVDGVEFLLMRAMSLKLIEGQIDETEGTVDIKNLAPRVLTHTEIKSLQTHLSAWVTKVDAATAMLNKDIGAAEAVAS